MSQVNYRQNYLADRPSAEELRALPWICFHCGFETADRKEAEAHFGDRDDAEEFTPLCSWWSKLSAEERAGEFQDLQKQIVSEQEDNANLRQRVETLEYLVDGQRSEIHSFKPFRECDSIHQIFTIYDSMEGRALLAEAQVQALEADRDALRNALKMVRTDFLEFEGCYCGQLIGGTNGEGEPLHVCGWCVTDAALSPQANDAATQAQTKEGK